MEETKTKPKKKYTLKEINEYFSKNYGITFTDDLKSICKEAGVEWIE